MCVTNCVCKLEIPGIHRCFDAVNEADGVDQPKAEFAVDGVTCNTLTGDCNYLLVICT